MRGCLCRLPSAVNVMLKLSIIVLYTSVMRTDYFNWFVVALTHKSSTCACTQTVLITPASFKPLLRMLESFTSLTFFRNDVCQISQRSAFLLQSKINCRGEFWVNKQTTQQQIKKVKFSYNDKTYQSIGILRLEFSCLGSE